jgi:hypothetical protein
VQEISRGGYFTFCPYAVLFNHEMHERHERRLGSGGADRGWVHAKGRWDGVGCTMAAVRFRER